MDEILRRRALGASVWTASLICGPAALVAWVAVGYLSFLSVGAGTIALGPAQVLRAAAVLRRGSAPCLHGLPKRVVSLFVAMLSVLFTAFAVGLITAGFSDFDDDAGQLGTFGGCLGVVALLRLWRVGQLEWSPVPREAAHRRIKTRMFGILFEASVVSTACVLMAAWLDGALFDTEFRSRIWIGAMVLVAAEAQVEALQGCTSMLAAGQVPSRTELTNALAEPLSVNAGGPGLGRWIALTTLAQAAAHWRQSPLSNRNQSGSQPQFGWKRRSAMPPLAADVFSLAKADPRRGKDNSGVATMTGYNGMLGVTGQQSGPFAVNVPTSRGLFAAYLCSASQVIQEFTVRCQSIAQVPKAAGHKTIRLVQFRALNARVVDLLPLFRIASAGVVGWICLSRDFDEAGVSQREGALGRIIIDLCDLLATLANIRPLLVSGALSLTPSCASAVKGADEEGKHSLTQLLLAFARAGLREVALPEEYRQFIDEFSG